MRDAGAAKLMSRSDWGSARSVLRWPVLFAALMVCVLLGRVHPAGAGEGPVRGVHELWYFKRPQPVALDGARVAVQHGPASLADSLAIIAPERGWRETGLIPGWSLIEIAGDAMPPASIEDRVVELIEEGVGDFVSPVLRDSAGGLMIVTPDLLVGVDRTLDARRALQHVRNENVGEVLEFDVAGMPNTFRVRIASRSGFDALAAAQALAQRPWVAFAEPDLIFTARTCERPNDPAFDQSWALNNVGQAGGAEDIDLDAPQAWDVTKGDPSIIVLVMDLGIQQDHPEINQVPGADFTGDGTGGGPGTVCDNHGTEVAGCLTAIINNEYGSAGIAPHCRIASARIARGSAQSPCDTVITSTSWLLSALAWGELIGARVSVTGLAFAGPTSALAQKYEDTRGRGMIHFAGAGNSGDQTIFYPAGYAAVNAVGAIDRFGQPAPFSSSGPQLAFAAPGVTIFTTDRTGPDGISPGDFATVSGTSFAAPFAAGVAALLLSRDPTLLPSDLVPMMAMSARDLGEPGFDFLHGWGLVNANDALRAGPADCNGNGLADGIDLAVGFSTDCNGNDMPDECDFDCDGNGVPDPCDISAIPALDCNGNGILDACTQLETDCNLNGVPDSCDIAAGASPDCEGNGVPDECDVVTGDCNLNGVPDACDLASGLDIDCNLNGVLDACDISAETSPDCNYDGIPDQCGMVSTSVSSDAKYGRDGFGVGVAIFGGRLVVGSRNEYGDDFSGGAAHVYVREPGTVRWMHEAALHASDRQPLDAFGASVAIADGVIAVGAPSDDHSAALTNAGSVYLFRFDEASDSWLEDAKLVAPNPASGAEFGGAVALHEDVLVVAAQWSDELGTNSGSAYVYQYDAGPGQWAHRATILPTGDAFRFGRELDLDAWRLVVGTWNRNLAFVYRYETSPFSLFPEAVLSASDGITSDSFGSAVSIDGDVVVIGSMEDDDNGTASGSVYVFRYDYTSGDWVEKAKLLASDGAPGMRFGASVAVQGEYALIGTASLSALRLYGFRAQGGMNWQQNWAVVVPDRTGAASIEIRENIAAVGVPGFDINVEVPGTALLFAGVTSSADCNWNEQPDDCDINAGISADVNRNAVPDECERLADVNRDGVVDVSDLIILLAYWGRRLAGGPDVNADVVVDVVDLLLLLSRWD